MAIDPVMREISKELMLDAAAALEAKDAEIASVKEVARACSAIAAENFARAKKAEAESVKLRAALEDAALVIERSGKTGFVVRGRRIDLILADALEQSVTDEPKS